MAKTPEELEAEKKKAAVTRTVRDVAKEGVAKVGKTALTGAKAVSKMKSGAEQYVGGQLRKGAGALVDKAAEMTPLDAAGAAAKVANQASDPIGAIANAIGDIEVGGGADQPAITNEPNEFDKAEDFLKQARSRNRGMSEEVANVMADIELARAETGLGRESEDSPAAPEAPAAPAAPEGANDFLAAQKDFNEKFGGSMGRAMEGETGDQYEARLKQRNVDRKAALGELAKLKPQDAAPAVADAAAPENTVLKPMGEITGTSFGDTSLDLTPREFMAPPASPQASSSARATASNAPTVITDPKERLKGRQEFGSYLENQLNRSGGSYTFNKGDQSRAKALGIGRKEMDNFMNRLGRRDDNQFGARGGLRRRNT